MKKLVLLSIMALVIIVVFVAFVFVAPRVRLARLEEALDAAPDAEAAAAVARSIMKSNSPRRMEVIQQYANKHESCAFDTTHDILLLCDETTGEIHEVYVGPEGPASSTGNASLDQAVTAAIPAMTSKRISIGNPPKRFEGIHVLSAKKDQVDFILKLRDEAEWYRVSCKFAEGRLTAQGIHGVSKEELQTWKEGQDWPPSWL